MTSRIYDDFDDDRPRRTDDDVDGPGEDRQRRYRLRELPDDSDAPQSMTAITLRVLMWIVLWPVMLLIRFPRTAAVAAVIAAALGYAGSQFFGTLGYIGGAAVFYPLLVGLVLYVHAPRLMLIAVAGVLGAAIALGNVIDAFSFIDTTLVRGGVAVALALLIASFTPLLFRHRERRVLAAGAASLIGAAALLISFWAFVLQATADLPTLAALREYRPPVMTRVHAGDGRLIQEYAREHRVFVPIETIPPRVVNAFLSAEDRNFYEHGGIDYRGTLRGGLRTIRNLLTGSGGLESGSTITQQVAKNFLLSSEQTLVRKVREFALAYRIERAFDKDQILELYLNEIYLGRRAYGVAAAALLYFNKPLDELTVGEAAFLAALPKRPGELYRNHEMAVSRRNWVVSRMYVNGYITEEEMLEAQAEPLVYSDRLEGETYTASEYFVEEVRRRVFSMYGDDELYYGGLSVRTTLDTRMQIAARDALRAGLEEYDRRYGYRGPIATIELGEGWAERLAEVELAPDLDNWVPAVVLGGDADGVDIGLGDGTEGRIPLAELEWARRVDEDGDMGAEIARADAALSAGEVVYVEALSEAPDEALEGVGPNGEPPEPEALEGLYGLRQVPEVNGAMIAMDPHTGRVLALVGGYSFRQNQFNRVVQARRQPGSSFKPFVYAAALDSGLTPADRVLDGPYVSTNNIDGTFYRPENYSAGRWYGLQTLRVGIEQSRNTMTVRLANQIGLERMSAYGERFGVYDDLPPYEAMALGAGETSLWRLATAYAELVNGGRAIEPTILDRVQDRDGVTIFAHGANNGCEGCAVEAWGEEFVEPELPDLREQIVDAVTAYQVTSMLEGVVQRGTGRRLRSLGFPVAGKTGTTNDYRDAWFVGFTPDLVAGVYVGFDLPRPLGANESGGRAALPVFQRFMADVMADRPAVPFRIPPGVRLVNIDSETGELARPGDPDAVLEAFRPGTEPTRYGASDGGDSSGGGLRIGTGEEFAARPPLVSPPSDSVAPGDGDAVDTPLPSDVDAGAAPVPPSLRDDAGGDDEEALDGLY